MKTTNIFLTSALIWISVTIIPYIIAGEFWSMVWYPLNYPVSEISKAYLLHFGLPAYVFATTVINSVIFSCLVILIIISVRYFRNSRTNN
jgi:hypothetical protein